MNRSRFPLPPGARTFLFAATSRRRARAETLALRKLLRTGMSALRLLPGLLLLPRPILGCAACYGQSDAPLARGMNWGILSLLVMIVLVLGGVAAFFVSLARRSAALASASAATAGTGVRFDSPAQAGVPADTAEEAS